VDIARETPAVLAVRTIEGMTFKDGIHAAKTEFGGTDVMVEIRAAGDPVRIQSSSALSTFTLRSVEAEIRPSG
jgi:hypothetical protein